MAFIGSVYTRNLNQQYCCRHLCTYIEEVKWYAIQSIHFLLHNKSIGGLVTDVCAFSHDMC